MKFRDTIVSALGPLWEMVEPFKVHDGTIERGIPTVHDELGKYLYLFATTIKVCRNSLLTFILPL